MASAGDSKRCGKGAKTYEIIPVVAYASWLLLLLDLVVSSIVRMLQQLRSVLKPLGKHVSTIETVAAETLHYAVAIAIVNDSKGREDIADTYILNMSIGSGSTRLS